MKGGARSAVVGGETRASDVLHRLRNDIIACVLKPGEKLRFRILREVYGASFSTIREALSHLRSERLVKAFDRRGFVVSPVSRQELEELTDARVLIECVCLERSIDNATEHWSVNLMAAFHRLDRTQKRLGEDFLASAEWDQLHFEFHDALTRGCGSLLLDEIRRNLFERAQRYRRLSALARTKPRAKSDEHRALMEAALARNGSLAKRLLQEHFRSTTRNILSNPVIEKYL